MMNKREEREEKSREKEENYEHRKFGYEHSWFFTASESSAPGFPLWGPKGYTLIEIIKVFINRFQREVCGVQLVKTPLLAKKELYLKTGHLPLYSENIFPPLSKEGKEELILRPMTCPHHILLAKELIKSVEQLPYLMGENALLHRDEYSGGLIGLKRVRAMELIDTHIFLLEEQITPMIHNSLSWILSLLRKFKIEPMEIVLATKSESEKYLSDDVEWEKAEELLFKEAQIWATKNELTRLLVVKKGGAAFYGPKIDFNVLDSLNQTYTISTLQLDVFSAKKLDFKLNSVYPIVLHLGLIGTFERFIAYLIERWRGRLPFWLTPVQLAIIPVERKKFSEPASLLAQKLRALGFRVELDLGPERFSKKVFKANQEKIPLQLLIGERESKSFESLTFKVFGESESRTLSYQEFIDYLRELNSEAYKFN